jgi:hypothetical protein
MEKEIDTAFLVTQFTDGSFSATLDPKDLAIEVRRQATANDVLSISNSLVKEIEQSQLTERLAVTLMQLLSPPAEPTVPDVLKEKLKERGITPQE